MKNKVLKKRTSEEVNDKEKVIFEQDAQIKTLASEKKALEQLLNKFKDENEKFILQQKTKPDEPHFSKTAVKEETQVLRYA